MPEVVTHNGSRLAAHYPKRFERARRRCFVGLGVSTHRLGQDTSQPVAETLSDPFDGPRASPELDEGTNGEKFETTD